MAVCISSLVDYLNEKKKLIDVLLIVFFMELNAKWNLPSSQADDGHPLAVPENEVIVESRHFFLQKKRRETRYLQCQLT